MPSPLKRAVAGISAVVFAGVLLVHSTTPLNASAVVSRTNATVGAEKIKVASFTVTKLVGYAFYGAVGGTVAGAVAGATIFNGPGAALGAAGGLLGGALGGAVVYLVQTIVGEPQALAGHVGSIPARSLD